MNKNPTLVKLFLNVIFPVTFKQSFIDSILLLLSLSVVENSLELVVKHHMVLGAGVSRVKVSN